MMRRIQSIQTLYESLFVSMSRVELLSSCTQYSVKGAAEVGGGGGGGRSPKGNVGSPV
jgi:hypothetical protein